MSGFSEHDVSAAESAVRAFLELYGPGMGADRSGAWIRACGGASGVFTRLGAARIARDPERARQHQQIAEELLDELLHAAERDPIQRGAVGRLAELLAEEGFPIPPKLGAWIASALASSKTQKAADPRTGAKNIEKAVICEAVFIASEWLPIYSNSSSASTTTAAAVVTSALYRLFGLNYSQEKIITYWKESKAVYQQRRG